MKHNLRSISALKNSGIPLTWLTCYDYSFASVLEETELDLILVGDSGGMVALGYSDTVPVSMDEMILLTSAVRRGAPNKFIVGDMPKGSYEVSNEVAVNNAMRFVKESGCDAIKLEGGENIVDRISAINASGIPVIGHIGLTPQSVASLGGYRVIGRSETETLNLKKANREIEEAGAFAILLEAVPPNLASTLSKSNKMITFGIGAGPEVDGQLLILHDALGLYPNFRPKFAKCFVPQAVEKYQLTLNNNSETENQTSKFRPIDGFWEIAKLAVEIFIDETRNRIFPDQKYSYKN